MWPAGKSRLRMYSENSSDDDEIVTDCPTTTVPPVRLSEFQKHQHQHTEQSDLIARDASSFVDTKSIMDKNSSTTSTTSDQIRYDSHIDSGFNSFRSLGGDSYHSVGGGDSNFGYTRLQSTAQTTVVDSYTTPTNIISSCYVRQPNTSNSDQISDLSSSTSSYSSNSTSSDVSDKISRLTLAEQKYSTALNQEQKPNSSAGSPLSDREKWCEAFQQDEDGDTLLHLAIIHCAFKIILNLINIAPHPAFLNLQNNLHQTPLHLAVLLNLPKVVRTLVVHGAILDVRDRKGNTALHLACLRGNGACVLELLTPISYQEMSGQNLHHLTEGWDKYAQPQDLEIRNYEGQTCVHLATFCKSKEILELLKQFDVNINAQEGKSGRTALHFAVEMGDFDLLNFLIGYCRADLNVRTFAGLTPIQFGYARNAEMVAVLRHFGAKDVGPAPFSDYESSESDSSMEESIMVTDKKEECDFMVNGEPLSSF